MTLKHYWLASYIGPQPCLRILVRVYIFFFLELPGTSYLFFYVTNAVQISSSKVLEHRVLWLDLEKKHRQTTFKYEMKENGKELLALERRTQIGQATQMPQEYRELTIVSFLQPLKRCLTTKPSMSVWSKIRTPGKVTKSCLRNSVA